MTYSLYHSWTPPLGAKIQQPGCHQAAYWEHLKEQATITSQLAQVKLYTLSLHNRGHLVHGLELGLNWLPWFILCPLLEQLFQELNKPGNKLVFLIGNKTSFELPLPTQILLGALSFLMSSLIWCTLHNPCTPLHYNHILCLQHIVSGSLPQWVQCSQGLLMLH